MSSTILAADSKLHLRTKGDKVFRGIIGTVVQSKDRDDLKVRYNNVLDDFFKELPSERGKKVYKASEILAEINGPPIRIVEGLRKVARGFLQFPNVDYTINFCTLHLPSLRKRYVSQFPEEQQEAIYQHLKEEGVEAKIIQIYGERGGHPVSYISVEDFFEKCRQYFPIICIGSLCRTAHMKECDIIVDGIQGERCGFWDLVVSSENIFSVAPSGDKTNYFLSIADIITRWIHEDLKYSGIPLNLNGIIRLLKEWEGVTADIDTTNIHFARLGNAQLKDMVPLSPQKIEIFHKLYYRRPKHFIFLEEKSNDERVRFENSPLMYRVHDRVAERNGSYIMWRIEHVKLVRKGDMAVVYGDNGLLEVQKLLDTGYDIDIWDLRK